ncbi:hypothetical protein IWQ60_010208 [Tieghemiomyces parasiticus]|uniref:Uncharacterized protein n=1 Tax=Tieghemiomyces parasiticus TaxID=78921 RepID=A0A9W8DIR4_9FUNG|nr:hypothetical protein IWQ60_010208 [Tieghemiomyces parasiticus]
MLSSFRWFLVGLVCVGSAQIASARGVSPTTAPVDMVEISYSGEFRTSANEDYIPIEDYVTGFGKPRKGGSNSDASLKPRWLRSAVDTVKQMPHKLAEKVKADRPKLSLSKVFHRPRPNKVAPIPETKPLTSKPTYISKAPGGSSHPSTTPLRSANPTTRTPLPKLAQSQPSAPVDLSYAATKPLPALPSPAYLPPALPVHSDPTSPPRPSTAQVTVPSKPLRVKTRARVGSGSSWSSILTDSSTASSVHSLPAYQPPHPSLPDYYEYIAKAGPRSTSAPPIPVTKPNPIGIAKLRPAWNSDWVPSTMASYVMYSHPFQQVQQPVAVMG